LVFFTGARVAGGARCAGTLLEDTEAGDVDLFALVDRPDDDVHQTVNGLRSHLLVVAQTLRQRLDQLGLVRHSSPP
jgi:hypothetical protein